MNEQYLLAAVVGQLKRFAIIDPRQNKIRMRPADLRLVSRGARFILRYNSFAKRCRDDKKK
jgi:hypothetical protein